MMQNAIKGIVEDPEVGFIYNGTVKRIMDLEPLLKSFLKEGFAIYFPSRLNGFDVVKKDSRYL